MSDKTIAVFADTAEAYEELCSGARALGGRPVALWAGDELVAAQGGLHEQDRADLCAGFQAAVADGCQHGIPVLKGIPVHNLFHKLRFSKLRPVDALGLAVALYRLTAPDDVVLLHLGLKPLVNLVFGLGALYHLQPVAAGTLAVLGGDNLDLVAVLDHIINVYQLSVDARAHHLVSDSRVDRVSEVDRRGAAWQCLYVSGRCKTVHAVGENIEVALDGI
mgnify:CR=1 FL=1